VLASLAGTPLEDALRYERERILNGELHRLVSAHFLHMSGLHLALNLAGLGLVWWLVGRYAPLRAWLLIVAASMLAVGLGLLAFAPELAWYVGLSGMLHGLLLAGALLAGRAGLPLVALVVIKLGWEQLAGAGTSAWLGGPVVVDAHLYGAIGGALAALGLRARPTAA
jgi:rhomboid family GlyGly-CTERM serine protease